MEKTSLKKAFFLFSSLNFALIVGVLTASGGFKSYEQKARRLSYSIQLNGKEIGHMELSKTSNDEESKYSFNSHVKYSFLKEFDIKFNIQSFFKNGNLVKSFSINKVNGETRSSCKIEIEDEGYHVSMDKKRYFLDTNSIQYSLATLYFHEPLKMTHVFSERYAKFLSIKQTKKQLYLIVMPDGRKNYYKFSEGICREVDVEIPFGNLQFKLKAS